MNQRLFITIFLEIFSFSTIPAIPICSIIEKGISFKWV